MAQTPSILGQKFPDADIDTNLFVVPIDNQAQFSVFVANHSTEMDYITIALIPNGGAEGDSNYIAFGTPLIGNGVLAFAGLFLGSLDRVQIKSANGTTSFNATGTIITP